MTVPSTVDGYGVKHFQGGGGVARRIMDDRLESVILPCSPETADGTKETLREMTNRGEMRGR